MDARTPRGGVRRRACAPPGFTLLELLLVVSIALLLAGLAVPGTLAGIDQIRAAAATRYVAGRLQEARMEAVKRGSMVGIRFVTSPTGTNMAAFVDGNDNGVRTLDIARAIDYPVGPPTKLEEMVGGASFGIVERVGDPDTGALLDGDPIRLGSGTILSFSPVGSATSGTLYLRGRGRQQYAVRVLGATGRVRILRYDFTMREWTVP